MEDQIDVQQTIRAARDSVWVIEDTIAKLAAGKTYTEELYDDIQRNVAHLKIIVDKDEIKDSGEDISDLHATIQSGEAKMSEYSA